MDSRRVSFPSALVLASVGWAAGLMSLGAGCAASTSTGDGGGGAGGGMSSSTSSSSVCIDGATLPCTCDGGTSNEAKTTCTGGKWGECACPMPSLGDALPPAEPFCGDYACNGKETCLTCPEDCGTCPKCDLAPTCTGAVSMPSVTQPEPGFSFDNGSSSLYSCGMDGTAYLDTKCQAPQLRMRLSQISVSKTGTSGRDLNLFCTITADDGTTSEVTITPLLSAVKGGTSQPVDTSKGIFWGQQGLKRSTNNLVITYHCYDVPQGESTFTKIMDSVQTGAAAVSGVAGPYGWAFGAGSVAAGVLGTAFSQNNDTKIRLSVQQTIDAKGLLDLTNGRTWTLHQSGQGDEDTILGIHTGWETWDWTIQVQTWGCAMGTTTSL